jgi:hypothetical protein
MNDFEIPAERDLPRGQLERRARHVVSELSITRRRRRLVLSIVPAVVVLLTAATGFTAYTLLRSEPTHFESIGCFDRDDIAANVTVVSPDGRGPLAQCRELWQQGVVGTQAPPRLAACVLSTGPIGVFPSTDDQTCERIGLADLTARGEAKSRSFIRMRDAIYALVGTPPSGSSRGSPLCVPEGPARRIVRRELDAHGYSDWAITKGGEPFSAARPCADVSFDSSSKTAVLLAGRR